MILKRIQVDSGIGDLTNCYIVEDEVTKETMVIDPGGEPQKILDMLNAIGGDVKYIVLTHCHADHISAVQEIKKQKGGKILVHRFDAEGLNNPSINLSNFFEKNTVSVNADSRLNDDDLLHIGNIEFKVIHTPGHTAGGICLYSKRERIVILRRYSISWNLGQNRLANK